MKRAFRSVGWLVVAGGIGSAAEDSPGVATASEAAGVRFAQSVVHVSELTTAVWIQVVREGDVGAGFSVLVETVPDTAWADRDYSTVRERLEFGADQSDRQVAVPILDNDTSHPPRGFTLRLLDPDGGVVLREPAEIRVEIRDNERAGGPVGTYFHTLPWIPFLENSVILNDGAIIGLTNVSILTRNVGVPIGITSEGRVEGRLPTVPDLVEGPLVAMPNGDFLGRSTLQNAQRQVPLLRFRRDGQRSLEWPTNLLVSVGLPTVLAAQADGTVHVGGVAVHQGVVRSQQLARILPDGTLDATFQPTFGSGSLSAVDQDAEGGLFVAGNFSLAPPQIRRNVLRLLPDGSLDPDFRSGFHFGLPNSGGKITAVLALPEGGCLVAGNFTMFDNLPRPHLVRLLPDGSTDPEFRLPGEGLQTPLGSTQVNGFLRDHAGRIYVFGRFLSLDGKSLGFPLLRLRSDGSRDESFDPGLEGHYLSPSSLVEAFTAALTPNGMVTVRGRSLPVDGNSLNGARLYLDALASRVPPVLEWLRFLGDQPGLRFQQPDPGRLVIEGADPGGADWNWEILEDREWPAGEGHWTDPDPDPKGRLYRLRREDSGP
jgi:hypothetical protein